MGLRSPHPGWAALEDADLDAFDEWLADEPADLVINFGQWLAGGQSSSRVATVIRTRGGSSALLVLRFCAGGDREVRRIRQAWEESPAAFRDRHLVEPVGQAIPLATCWALFQRIGGGDIGVYQPVADHLDSPTLAKDGEAIAASVVADWNPAGPRSLAPTTPAALLSEIVGDRVSRPGGLSSWLREMDIDAENPMVPYGAMLAEGRNPLSLLTAPGSGSTLAVARGLAHGDLNARNILLAADESPRADYRLVDLGEFTRDGPLCRDPINLLLSIATLWLPRLDLVTDGLAMIAALFPDGRCDTAKFGRLRSISEGIHRAARAWAREKGIGRDWEQQTYLSLIGNAVVFAARRVPDGIDVPGDAARRWFFSLAVFAATRYLERWPMRFHPVLETRTPSRPVPLASQTMKLSPPSPAGRTPTAARTQVATLSEADRPIDAPSADQRPGRRDDRTEHFLLRARGLDTATGDLWLFTGRSAVLRELAGWVRGPDSRTMLLTGFPGSGKSAVLGRFVVFADPQLRRTVEWTGSIDETTVPPEGCVSCAIHARDRTAAEILEEIQRAVGTSPGPLRTLIEAFDGEGAPRVVLIDSVDEAQDPDELLREVLVPLASTPGLPRLRLIIGANRYRAHLLREAAVDPCQTIDLDEDPWSSETDMAAFVQRCLVELVPNSPYRAAEPSLIRDVARRIADAAGTSFLVATITARSHAGRSAIADPTDDAWITELPRGAAAALWEDLRNRLGPQVRKARDLLVPLAFAQDPGLPWSQFWAPIASLLSGHDYTTEDLQWLRRHAGHYLTESDHEGLPTARLFHSGLADELRRGLDERAVHQAYVTVLSAAMPSRRAVDVEWHPYLRRNLALHAAACGGIDELLDNPAYLLNAESHRLRSMLDAAASPEAKAAAAAYRSAFPVMGAPQVETRASSLEFAARCHDADTLADLIGESCPTRAWSTAWTSWVPDSPHRRLGYQSQAVTCLAAARATSGRAISGDVAGTVCVWDVERSVLLRRHDRTHGGRVRDMVTARVGDRSFALSAGEDGTLRLWDLSDGTPVGPAWSVGEAAVLSLTCYVTSRLVAVVGDGEGQLHLWDPFTRERIGAPVPAHSGPVYALAAGDLDDRLVVVSGGGDASVAVFDVSDGSLSKRTSLLGHSDWVTSVCVDRLGGAPAIVTGGQDGTVRTWTFAAGDATPRPRWWRAHPGPVTAVTVGATADAVVVVTAGADQVIRIWDTEPQQPASRALLGHTSSITGLCVMSSAQRPLIISAGLDRSVRAWDLADAPPPVARPWWGHHGVVGHLAATSDSGGEPCIASGGFDASVRLWRRSDGQSIGLPLATRIDDLLAVRTVDGAGGPVVVVAGADNEIESWDAETGLRWGPAWRSPHRQTTAVAVGGLGADAYVICGTADGLISTWGLTTAQAHAAWHASDTGITAVTTGADQVLFSAGEDGVVHCWDPLTGQPIGVPWKAHDGPVTEILAVDTAGGTTVVTAGTDGLLRSWRHPSGEFLAEGLSDNEVTAVVVLPFSGMVLVGDRSGMIRSWDVLTGAWTPVHWRAHAGAVLALACSPTEEGNAAVVSAGTDGLLQSWDAATGRPAGQTPFQHTGPVVAVCLAQLEDVPLVVSAGADCVVQAWNATDGRPFGPPRRGHGGAIPALSRVASDSRPMVATGGQDGIIRLWDLRQGDPADDEWHSHREPVLKLATIGEGPTSMLISSGGDHKVRQWSLAPGVRGGVRRMSRRDLWRKIPVLERARDAISLSNTTVAGRPVAVLGMSDGSIRLHDVRARRLVGRIDGLPGQVACVAGDPGSSLLVAGGDGFLIRASLTPLADARTRGQAPQIRYEQIPTDGYVHACAVDVAGNHAVACESELRFYPAHPRLAPAVIDVGSVITSIALGSDGSVAVSSYAGIALLRVLSTAGGVAHG